MRRRPACLAATVAVVWAGISGRALAITNPGYRGLEYPQRSVLSIPGEGGTRVNTLTGNLVVRRSLVNLSGKGLPVEMTLTYNSDHRLISSPFGMGWSFSYAIRYVKDGAGNVAIVWGDGRVDLFTAAGGGTFTAPTGVYFGLTEPSPGDLRLRSKEGIELRFANTAHKKLTSIVDSNGNALTLSYAGSRLASLADQGGRAWTFTYDGTGRLASIAGPGAGSTFAYDAANRLSGISRSSGPGETIAYDGDNLITGVTDRRGNATSISYLTPGGAPGTRLAAGIAKGGSTTSYAYDLPARTTRLTDPNSNTWQYVYDAGGDLVQLFDPELLDTVLTWSANDDLTTFQDRRNRTRTYSYDSRGNLTSATVPLVGATTGTTTIAYEPALNRPTSITDPLGNVSTLEYDARGNLLKLNDPVSIGTSQSWVVDAAGQPTSETDRTGATSTFAYDAYGRITTITDPLGHPTQLSYGLSGRLMQVTDANGHSTTYGTDPVTGARQVTDARGNADSSLFDANGNLIEYHDREGNITRYTYDALDRLVSVTDSLGNTDTRSYDASGHLIGYEDKRGNPWSQTFNSRGLLASRSHPLGGTWSYTYDANGNLGTVTDAKGQVTEYSHDYASRLVEQDFADGRRAQFTYDANNNLLTAKDGLVSPATPYSDYTYTYDALGREKSAVDNLVGKTALKSYDGEGRMTVKALQDYAGGSATYAYDAAANLVSLTVFGGTSTFTYDAVGNRITEAPWNGMSVTRTYDANDDLASIVIRNHPAIASGSVASSFSYTRDKNGRVVQTARQNGENILYEWDALGRPRQESGTFPGVYSFQHGYDANGNWTTFSGSLGGSALSQTTSFDAANRPTTRSLTVGGSTTVFTYTYDANGNRVATTLPPAGPAAYSYDAANRLIGLTPSGGSPISYGYNALNQLTRRTGGGSTLKAVYGSPDVLAWLDSANTVVATYFTLAAINNRFNRDPASRYAINVWLAAIGYRLFNPWVNVYRMGDGFGRGRGRDGDEGDGDARYDGYLNGRMVDPWYGCWGPPTPPPLLYSYIAALTAVYVSQTIYGTEYWFAGDNLPYGFYDPCWDPITLVANALGSIFFRQDYFMDAYIRYVYGGLPIYHYFFANAFGGMDMDGYVRRGGKVNDPEVRYPLNPAFRWLFSPSSKLRALFLDLSGAVRSE